MIDLSWSCFRQARIYVNKIQFCWSFYSTAKQFHVLHSWSPLTIIARLHIAANCKMKQKHGKERIFHQELTINLLFLLFIFLVVINWKIIEINSKTLASQVPQLPWIQKQVGWGTWLQKYWKDQKIAIFLKALNWRILNMTLRSSQ